MNRLITWLAPAGIASALFLGAIDLNAQQERPQRGNFDPAQMRQRMMDRYKEQLEVTDDTEWKAIQPLIEKVTTARMASMSGMGRGMFGRGGAGGPGGDNAQADRTQRRGPAGQANAEADALQKAIDAKASGAELKTALQKYVDARKAKQTELEAAQAKLRSVLTPRQEAIATLNGLL